MSGRYEYRLHITPSPYDSADAVKTLLVPLEVRPASPLLPGFIEVPGQFGLCTSYCWNIEYSADVRCDTSSTRVGNTLTVYEYDIGQSEFSERTDECRTFPECQEAAPVRKADPSAEMRIRQKVKSRIRIERSGGKHGLIRISSVGSRNKSGNLL